MYIYNILISLMNMSFYDHICEKKLIILTIKYTYMYMSEVDYYNSLKASRVKANLTQKEVEQKLNMRSLMMRDYEVGRLKLPVTVAVQLAELYRVSLYELLNIPEGKNKRLEQALARFKIIFAGSDFALLYLDPVLKAFLESHQDRFFEESLFEILMTDFNEKIKKQFIVELAKMLSSLAAMDGKVADSETDCIAFILNYFQIEIKQRAAALNYENCYTPTNLPTCYDRPEVKHFTIWILFLFARADGKIDYREIEYIDLCAQNLKLNKSNYLFIKDKFCKEKF